MSTTRIVRGAGGMAGQARPTYSDVQHGREFVQLRRKFRRFVFPVTILFLTWYFLYVVLAAFAPGFMGTTVVGNINIGLLFGLGQFASTFTITMIYVRWADREFDPTAERLRAHMEGPESRDGDAFVPPAARVPATIEGGERR